MQRRQATAEEIIQLNQWNIEHDWRVSYRHFVREIYNPRAEHGVSHRQYSKAKLHVINGRPHVTYQGRLEEVTGDLVTTESGRQFIGSLRLNSPHLAR